MVKSQSAGTAAAECMLHNLSLFSRRPLCHASVSCIDRRYGRIQTHDILNQSCPIASSAEWRNCLVTFKIFSNSQDLLCIIAFPQ